MVERIDIKSGDSGVQGFLGNPIQAAESEKGKQGSEKKISAEQAVEKIVQQKDGVKESEPTSIVGKGEPVKIGEMPKAAKPKSQEKKAKQEKKISKMLKVQCSACNYEFDAAEKEFGKGVVKCPYCGISSTVKPVAPKQKEIPPDVVYVVHKMYECSFCSIGWLKEFGKNCPRCGREATGVKEDKAPVART